MTRLQQAHVGCPLDVCTCNEMKIESRGAAFRELSEKRRASCPSQTELCLRARASSEISKKIRKNSQKFTKYFKVLTHTPPLTKGLALGSSYGGRRLRDETSAALKYKNQTKKVAKLESREVAIRGPEGFHTQFRRNLGVSASIFVKK